LGFIVPKDLSDIGGRTAMLAIRHQIPAHHAGVSVLLDRFFDVLIMTLLLGPAVLFLSKTAGAVVSISLMIFVAVIFYIALHLFYDSISGLITGTYNVMVGVARRLPLIRRKTLKKLDGFSVGKPDFAKAYLLSIVKFLCTVIRFIFFARAIEMPVSPFVFFLGTPMGQLSFLFAFTPGGLGIFEAGWYAILVQVGTPVSYIVPFLLGQRVFTVLFIGMLFVVDQLSLLFFAENE
jgi:uncharacterized protein (TIRG00374 family)